MAKWFVEYSIVQVIPSGWTERDGDKFFTLPVEKLSLEIIEVIIKNIANEHGVPPEDVAIDNIAKINTN
ncbi:hypothetical protein D3C87_324340 [compost metagenome]